MKLYLFVDFMVLTLWENGDRNIFIGFFKIYSFYLHLSTSSVALLGLKSRILFLYVCWN